MRRTKKIDLVPKEDFTDDEIKLIRQYCDERTLEINRSPLKNVWYVKEKQKIKIQVLNISQMSVQLWEEKNLQQKKQYNLEMIQWGGVMTNKICDICHKECDKTYAINLTDGDNDIDLKGKIDLCPICANKIKQAISKMEEEV